MTITDPLGVVFRTFSTNVAYSLPLRNANPPLVRRPTAVAGNRPRNAYPEHVFQTHKTRTATRNDTVAIIQYPIVTLSLTISAIL